MKFPVPAKRRTRLADKRNLKMASSAQAYVRGSTLQFYEWLQSGDSRNIPNGPPVWICGDCHSGNLGPVADSKGNIEIQIRDLDQSVIGNPNHDLIRLALSLAFSARGSDLPGVTTAYMLEEMIEGYREALIQPRNDSEVQAAMPDFARVVMRDAVSRTWKHLARERLRDEKPDIPLGKRFWPLSTSETEAIGKLFAEERVRRMVTLLKSRDNDAEIEVLDAAFWMKGCSSLGRLRFAVLIEVAGRDDRDNRCLIDIKEAVPAAAPRAAGAKMPRDNGERVVEGARHLSPSLGDRMVAAQFLRRSVFLRELMPQDLKLDIDQLSCREAIRAARFLAAVLGRAHSRQMDAATRREFRASLSAQRSKRLQAPSWLWSSVVELSAVHEAGYLDHCRNYALQRNEAA
jgi:uncharacterized protein (DUF2252 family)